MTEPGPFQIAIPDSVLDDLARRLAGARLPPPQSVPDGEPGDPAGEDDEVIDRIAGLLADFYRGATVPEGVGPSGDDQGKRARGRTLLGTHWAQGE